MLYKIGTLIINHFLGYLKKLISNKYHYIRKILEHNHFTIIGKIKARLEEKNSKLNISEYTICRELKNLNYISVISRKVFLLI